MLKMVKAIRHQPTLKNRSTEIPVLGTSHDGSDPSVRGRSTPRLPPRGGVIELGMVRGYIGDATRVTR